MALTVLPLLFKHITIKFAAVYNESDMKETIRLFAEGKTLKYTDQGLVSVSLSYSKTHRRKRSERTICLSVKDTGKGMSPDFLHNHAFTPFVQESQFSAGAGLGLSIVRLIVNALGGKIEMQSQMGVGTETKVWRTLPFVPSPKSCKSLNDQLQTMIQRTTGLTMCTTILRQVGRIYML